MKALKKIKPIWIVVAVLVIAIGIWYWKIGRFVGLPSLDGKKEEPETKSTAPSGSNYSSGSNCKITKSNWSHYKDLELKRNSPHKCAVMLLQKSLGITADGVFGSQTEKAVEKYSTGWFQTSITLRELNDKLNNKIYNSLS